MSRELKLVKEIAGWIRVRACDPWDDHLWPAANEVLIAIADELEEGVGDLGDYFTEGCE